jgi:hypothetical protein
LKTNLTEHFINNIIGDVVEVKRSCKSYGVLYPLLENCGETLLETIMVGPRPDIIINAFSTNDIKGGNLFSAIQEFVR